MSRLIIVESPSKRALLGAQMAREDLESGLIFKYVDNAEAISKLSIRMTQQEWARVMLMKQFDNLDFDNGPHSFTRVVLRHRLTESAGLMSVIFVIQMVPRAVLAPVAEPLGRGPQSAASDQRRTDQSAGPAGDRGNGVNGAVSAS